MINGIIRDKFMGYAKYSNDLLQLEADIIKYSKLHENDEFFCANGAWYASAMPDAPNFKRRLCELVGWSASNLFLNSCEAYDCAYEYLYELLPDCRHEGMCW